MTSEKKKRRRFDRGLPKVGTELVHKYKGTAFAARVVADTSVKSGRAVELDGKRYSTLTAAARAITGRAVNGWVFWRTK